MENSTLPINVYKHAQDRYQDVPGNPWVYWVSKSIVSLFNTDEAIFLSSLFPIDMGLKTSGNERFVRYWWEVSPKIKRNAQNRDDAIQSRKKWFPYTKSAAQNPWGSRVWNCVNWFSDGKEIKTYLIERYPYLKGDPTWCTHNENLYFKPSIVWKTISTKGFYASLVPPGCIISNANYGIFPPQSKALELLGVLNSDFIDYLLMFLSPTINFNKGEVEKIPIIQKESSEIASIAMECYSISTLLNKFQEASPEFILPSILLDKFFTLAEVTARLLVLQKEVNSATYNLYGISSDDIDRIDTELRRRSNSFVIEDDITDAEYIEEDADQINISNTPEEKYSELISYCIGIVLGRFYPGRENQLGSAILSLNEFKIEGLATLSESNLNDLIGLPSNYQYVEKNGERHVFSENIKKAFENVVLNSSIATLDQSSPYDLTNRVNKVLEIMLGELGARTAIEIGAGGDLRRFIEKEYFSQIQLKWYRKRPVYWYVQSNKRSYGFVIFHEKITRDTFYAIQREPYLDTRRNAVNLEMQDVQARIKQSAGGERKKLEKRLAELRDLADELTQFAKDLEEITRNGYEPEPNWIDDGVILRMAPLWKVIPLWKSEPKKYWERLEAGDFDWSHIAMKYWPDRVRQKCRTNKSYAIAHGHEEWYEGK